MPAKSLKSKNLPVTETVETPVVDVVSIVENQVVQPVDSIVEESNLQVGGRKKTNTPKPKKEPETDKSKKIVKKQQSSDEEEKKESEAKPKAKAKAKAKVVKPDSDSESKAKSKVAKPESESKPKTRSKKKSEEEDNEHDDDTDRKIRSFKVKLPEKEDFEGRFTGLTPYQAANKALSKYYRESAEPLQEITFSIIESTRKSKKTTYTYVGKRQKLEVPISYTIADGKQIIKNYKNFLKKIKKNEVAP